MKNSQYRKYRIIGIGQIINNASAQPAAQPDRPRRPVSNMCIDFRFSAKIQNRAGFDYPLATAVGQSPAQLAGKNRRVSVPTDSGRNVFTKASKTRGRGVFAARRLRKGEEILTIDDSRVGEDTTTLSDDDWKYNADYFDGRITIMQEPERSINHSCDPNCHIMTLNGLRRIFAMRDIAEGGETAFDYAINGDHEGPFACHCGSARCRIICVGNCCTHPIELQKEYLPYLEEWFKKRHVIEIDALENRRQEEASGGARPAAWAGRTVAWGDSRIAESDIRPK